MGKKRVIKKVKSDIPKTSPKIRICIKMTPWKYLSVASMKKFIHDKE